MSATRCRACKRALNAIYDQHGSIRDFAGAAFASRRGAIVPVVVCDDGHALGQTLCDLLDAEIADHMTYEVTA